MSDDEAKARPDGAPAGGAVTPATVNLGHGTLVLGADGAYTYTLDNTNAAVNALNDGQSLTDSYTYTITDAEGSSTTATLSITINGHTDGTPVITVPDTDGAANATDTTLPETAGAFCSRASSDSSSWVFDCAVCMAPP